jgi:hypothetical protein
MSLHLKFYLFLLICFFSSCITEVNVYVNGPFKQTRIITAISYSYVDRTHLTQFKTITIDTTTNKIVQRSWGITKNLGWTDFSKKKKTITYNIKGKKLVKEMIYRQQTGNSSIYTVKSFRQNYLKNWESLNYEAVDSLLQN